MMIFKNRKPRRMRLDLRVKIQLSAMSVPRENDEFLNLLFVSKQRIYCRMIFIDMYSGLTELSPLNRLREDIRACPEVLEQPVTPLSSINSKKQ